MSLVVPAARKQQSGFTLVELVVGIVTLGIALAVLSALIFPQAQRSTVPFQQMKAAQLGQSLMDEILNKAFDEQSIRPGALRCDEIEGEPEFVACTSQMMLGPEESDRSDFNDVDDFHELELTLSQLEDTLGRSLEPYFTGFSAAVRVFYDADLSATENTSTSQNTALFKRVEVTITLPDGSEAVFAGYRGNY
ncbi:type IV pilus modification PilV family protein [Aliidiomarina indica]|uniref:type IV pilus modification PilV family protein n=1 Tax=Aliidiomarina indica TaxID=2749147 RepID=UPI00188E18DD|nr:type II secretion system protein [Aliidiomarina indica]